MITPYLPYPPSSGGQVRSYNLIKQLSQKNEIILLSLIKDPEEKQYLKELKKYCRQIEVFRRPRRPWTLKNIFRTGFGFYPFLVIRNFSLEAKKAVQKLIKENKIDLIHAETFYVMPHIPPTQIPILLVEQTIEYQVYRHYIDSLPPALFFLRPFLYLDVFKLRWWEKYFWQKANLVVAVSEADKAKMTAEVKGLGVGVVPNGAGEDLMTLFKKRKTTKDPTIFFQANFNWLQNIEAANFLAKDVFPLIQKEIPQAHCWIVGQNAKEKIGHLTSQKIRVVDLKTDDTQGVINAYQKATIFVAPLQGPGGTRLKILAAMAAGVPVVTTSVGIQGINARHKKEAFIVDTWPQMAAAAVQLIKEKKNSQKIAQQARQLIEREYSYQSIAASLDKIYHQVAHDSQN